MAYQRVGTPRFYIDFGEWQKSLGNLDLGIRSDFSDEDTDTSLNLVSKEDILNIIGLNPVTPLTIPVNGINSFGQLSITSGVPNGVGHEGFPNYVAILNHNFASASVKATIFSSTTGGVDSFTLSTKDNILNYESENSVMYNNGCSITTLDDDLSIQASKYIKFLISSGEDASLSGGATTYTDDISIGSISFGRFYDMPQSPDLDLSMEIEFDGYDQIQTMGGSTLTNVRYAGSPWWSDKDGNKVEPWSVGQSTGVSKRNGRRTWNMKFSYISDEDIFSSNYMSNTYAENLSGYTAGDTDLLNLGAELLTTTNLGSLTNEVMSAGDSELGWTHHATHDYDSATKVTAGVTLVSDGTPDSESDKYQSLHSNSFSITAGVEYQVEYSFTVTSGKLTNVNIISDPVGAQLGYSKSFDNSTGLQSFSETFIATATDTASYFEFYTKGSQAVDVTIHTASIKPVHRSDFYHTLDTDNSFVSQVLNKVGNGQKFIFQPDNTANNPSDFAICQLDQDSLSIKQVAYKTYEFGLKIREVW